LIDVLLYDDGLRSTSSTLHYKSIWLFIWHKGRKRWEKTPHVCDPQPLSIMSSMTTLHHQPQVKS